jgi:uncharacterized iron-regulated protein
MTRSPSGVELRGATALRVRTAEAGEIDEAAALDALAAGRVVLLGERHDSAADHAWQARLIEGIVARAGPVTVGFEMFPRRAQPALDAYSQGRCDLDSFLAAARWGEVWGFDPALYRGLFELCRNRRLGMLALNVDRPIVSLVGREGWGALPEAERAWLSEAAPAAPAYRRYLFNVTGGARPDRAATSPDAPEFDRFVRAQQVWDRAFACAIAAHLAHRPEDRVVGIIGRGHLEYGWGTPAQLRDLGVGGIAVALPNGASAKGRSLADFVWSQAGGATRIDLAQ